MKKLDDETYFLLQLRLRVARLESEAEKHGATKWRIAECESLLWAIERLSEIYPRDAEFSAGLAERIIQDRRKKESR